MNRPFYTGFDTATRMPSQPRPEDYRSAFQVDRDRIIHTAAFRRLQNKTQVFLSGEYDFYRTRLTHSIEVAQIGRSICARFAATSPLPGPDGSIDGDLVEAACLAHDIGHPPFGHTGERTLNRLMRPYGGFEGNAQTLRLLTRTIFSGQHNGMNPTRAFMDAVLKYKTLHSQLADPENHFIYDDQAPDLAFVLDGEAFPESLPPGVERDAVRSIECQIMDWADDTAYSLNDVADGIRAGFITCDRIERWAEDQSLEEEISHYVVKLCDTIRRDRVESRLNRKIGEFIAAAGLVEDSTFLGNKTGRHRLRLVIGRDAAQECRLYKSLSSALVFQSPQLQQLDRKADQILSKLFGAFAEEYIVPDRPSRNHFRILPADEEKVVWEAGSEAARARLVCDAVASMTDGFASRTYQRLFDAAFGSILDLI